MDRALRYGSRGLEVADWQRFLANRVGFYWGGHFARRPDGMHFELARVG